MAKNIAGEKVLTNAQLCKAIILGVPRLSEEGREAIQRIYAKTWSVVYLYREKLAVPTPACWERLADLWQAVQKEFARENEGRSILD